MTKRKNLKHTASSAHSCCCRSVSYNNAKWFSSHHLYQHGLSGPSWSVSHHVRPSVRPQLFFLRVLSSTLRSRDQIPASYWWPHPQTPYFFLFFYYFYFPTPPPPPDREFKWGKYIYICVYFLFFCCC